MERKFVYFELRGKIAVVTFNNPEKRNPLNSETWDQFYRILKEIESDETVRAVVITGSGEAFVAGADISRLSKRTRVDALEGSREGNEILRFLEELDRPVIAAINGWALGGGCELALACDIRIASEHAKIGQTEVRIGIMPGYGGNIRLSRLIGTGRAKEMIFTGKIVDAWEAERIGLVNRVVPHERLMDETIELAETLSKGPASIRLAKKAINHVLTSGLDELVKRDIELYGDVYETEDHLEGIDAFLEKRKPLFKGR
jgi:enoyl-CoA hydratase